MQRERKEQEWTVNWMRLQYPNVLVSASANGGSRNCIEAKNLKRSGVTPGIPDLQIFKAARGFHGLFIEMKAPATATSARGRLSTVQTNCLNYLNGEGYYAVAAWGFEEAKKIISWYLKE